MAKQRRAKPASKAPLPVAAEGDEHVISSEDEEPVRSVRDSRPLDVIVRQLVRGRAANRLRREELLVNDVLSHLYQYADSPCLASAPRPRIDGLRMCSFGVTAAAYLDTGVETYPQLVARTIEFREHGKKSGKIDSVTYEALPAFVVDDFVDYWVHRWVGIREFYDVPSLCRAAVDGSDPFMYEKSAVVCPASALQRLLGKLGVHRVEDLVLLDKFDDRGKRDQYRQRVVSSGFEATVTERHLLTQPQAEAAAPHVQELFKMWEVFVAEYELSKSAISSYAAAPGPSSDAAVIAAPVRRTESSSPTGGAALSANRPAHVQPPQRGQSAVAVQQGVPSTPPPKSSSAAASPSAGPKTPVPAPAADEGCVFSGAGQR